MAQIVFENIDENNLQDGETNLLILEKMIAIQDNLKAINKDFFDSKMLEITVDLSNQSDEFFIEDNFHKNYPNMNIEVVTKEVAISNELELLRMGNQYTKEEIETYELGGCLSCYKKLGTSEFYFREL